MEEGGCYEGGCYGRWWLLWRKVVAMEGGGCLDSFVARWIDIVVD